MVCVFIFMQKMSTNNERVKNRVLIRYLHDKGYSVMDIAKELKVSDSTVRRWINREIVANMPKSGRPSAMQPEMALVATSILKEKAGSSINDCKRTLEDAFPEMPISREAIRTWSLKQPWGRPYKISKAPMISETE